MKNLIFKDWGWIRAARLLFAIYMFYKGYISGDMIYYIIGGLLGYQAIFNIKCLSGACVDDSCTVPQKKTKDIDIAK